MSDSDDVGPYMDALEANLLKHKKVEDAGQLVVVSNDSTTKSPLATDALGKNKQLPAQTEKQADQKEALAKTAAEKKLAEDEANRMNMDEFLSKENTKMEEDRGVKCLYFSTKYCRLAS